ncbi:hypothetical protein V2I01_28080 [Micromonospora sp. BRA006-A]|nr:hypothetical protein [Micromonospora sp. BRA006-A]
MECCGPGRWWCRSGGGRSSAAVLFVLPCAAVVVSLSLGTPYVAPVDVARSSPARAPRTTSWCATCDCLARSSRRWPVRPRRGRHADPERGPQPAREPRRHRCHPGCRSGRDDRTGPAARWRLVAPAALLGGLVAAVVVLRSALRQRPGGPAVRARRRGGGVRVPGADRGVMLTADPIDGCARRSG